MNLLGNGAKDGPIVSLVGNAPFIVDKYKGEIHVTGTARGIEFYMEQFEKEILPKIKSNE